MHEYEKGNLFDTNLNESMELLQAAGLEVTEQDTLKDIAHRAGKSPHEIYLLIKLKEIAEAIGSTPSDIYEKMVGIVSNKQYSTSQ